MKKSTTAILLFLIMLIVSCKHKEGEEQEVKVEVPTEHRIKKVLTEEDKKRPSSLMSNLMLHPDTKQFASMVVTSGQAHFLTDSQGPIIVFAPSNKAFEKLSAEEKKVFNNKEKFNRLQELVEMHILKDSIIYQSFLNNTDKLENHTFATATGNQLILNRNKSGVFLQNSNKERIFILDTVDASNGTLFVIDRFFEWP